MREIVDILCLIMAGCFLLSALVHTVRRAPSDQIIISLLMALIMMTTVGL